MSSTRCRAGTTGCRHSCSARTGLPRPFPESAITRPFPFNAYYPESRVRTVDAASWRLELGGLVENKTLGRSPTCARCRRSGKSPAISASRVGARSATGAACGSQRFSSASAPICVGGMSGSSASNDYYTSIDMATALHPQTLLALDYGDGPLPPKYGAPLKLRIPDQAWLQKSQIHRGALRHQQVPGRLLGRPGLQLVQRLLTGPCREVGETG